MRLIQYAIILPVFAIFISISSDFKSLSLTSTRQGSVCIMVKLFTQYKKCFLLSLSDDSLVIKDNFPFQEVVNTIAIGDLFEMEILDIPYYIEEKEIITDNIISVFPLGYKYNDIQYSIIHNLYVNNIIKEEGFGILFSKGSNRLFLEGYSSTIIEKQNEYKFNYTIDVDRHYPTWGAKINYVSIGKKKYNSNSYFHFETNTTFIYVPEKFMEFLINELNIIYHTRFDVDCILYYDQLVEFPDLTFSISGINFILTSYDFFSCEGKNCVLMIKYDKDIGNQWIIGDIFLTKYFAFFDYSTSTITLLSKTQLTIITINKEIIFPLLHILEIQCIITILLLVITIFYYDKNKNKMTG